MTCDLSEITSEPSFWWYMSRTTLLSVRRMYWKVNASWSSWQTKVCNVQTFYVWAKVHFHASFDHSKQKIVWETFCARKLSLLQCTKECFLKVVCESSESNSGKRDVFFSLHQGTLVIKEKNILERKAQIMLILVRFLPSTLIFDTVFQIYYHNVSRSIRAVKV